MTWLLMYSVTRLYIPCQKSNLNRTQIRTSVIWWSRDFDFGDSKLAKVVFVITWKLKLDIFWIWNSLGSLKFLICSKIEVSILRNVRVSYFSIFWFGKISNSRNFNVYQFARLEVNIFTSKVSKMIIWQIQYFGVQAQSWVRLPKA